MAEASWRQAHELLDRLPALNCDWELRDLAACAGRVLAEEIRWDRDHPPYDRAAMDGFALIEEPRAGMELVCIGEAAAGSPWVGTLESGQCLAIATGACVPRGANWVVPVELCRQQGQSVLLLQDCERRHIHRRGQDAREGELLLEPPALLGATHLAVLASVGRTQVKVRRKLRIAALATGSELVRPECQPEPHQIRVTHLMALHGLLACTPCLELTAGDLVLDREEAILGWLQNQTADLLITTGGVGPSRHDLLPRCLEHLGFATLFHGLAIKPGHPVLLAAKGKQVVLSLPGNPVSVLACWALLGWRLVSTLLGLPKPAIPKVSSTEGLSAPSQRDLLQPWNQQECARVTWNGSGDLAALPRLDSFVLVPRASREAHGPFPLFRLAWP